MKSSRPRLPIQAVLRIAQRDQWTCHVCKQKYMPSDEWQIDHDVPLAKGGTNLVTNLRLAHASCNNAKSDA